MQRNGRQGALGLNRTQPVLNSPATVHVRRTVNINDLENRVTTTEKTNQQVLNELSELKRELQNALGNENGADGYYAAAPRPKNFLANSVDSDVSILPTRRGVSKQGRQGIEQAANEMLTVFHRLGTTDKALQKVTADLQTIGARCGSQGVDIQNLYQELKNFDSKLEGVLRSEIRSVKAEISGNYSQNNPFVQNAAVMANTIEQLQITVTHLENRVEHDANERLRFENNVHSSILELATRLSDTEKSMRDALADLKAEVRTNAQELISLRQGMRSEVEEMSSKLNLRLSAAIKKMQEELSTSKTEIEAALGRLSMTSRPVDLKLAELESALAKLEKSIGADMNELREDQQVNQKKLLNSLSQLDLAVEVLEQGLTDEKEQLKGVIAAEIKARKARHKLQELDEKVGDTANKVETVVEDLNEKVTRLDDDVKCMGERGTSSASTHEIAQKLKYLEDDVNELQKEGQQESEEVQESLTNIAEAVQAVKTALLAKMESAEKETSDTIEKLSAEIATLKEQLSKSPRNNPSSSDKEQS